MPAKEDEAIQVIAKLYEAAIRPARWRDALEGLRTAFGGAKSIAFVHDTETGQMPLWFGVGTEDGKDEYIEDIHFINPCAQFCMTHRPGTVAWDHRVLPERAMDRHPFYDWLRRQSLRYFLGTRLFEDGPLNGFASVNWSASHGHADEKDVELFRRLQPHLERALRLTVETRRHEARSTALDAALHLFDFGIVLLDARGKVVFANAFAERIFARCDGPARDSSAQQSPRTAGP
ncbi:MAG: hypothetical protein ACRECX_00940 [Methyloceanibacter sp.]|uniref:hypothetical protein n=1 Tax=Methyloceanibacter sp. TaxID=1965321 RepID=UPI003D6D2D37